MCYEMSKSKLKLMQGLSELVSAIWVIIKSVGKINPPALINICIFLLKFAIAQKIDDLVWQYYIVLISFYKRFPVKHKILYKPSFAAIFITLAPGESITAEAGAMTSMDGQISMKTEFSGGLFSGLIKKYFGGESLFVNRFINQTQSDLQVVLSQPVIGDIEAVELKTNREICFQPGAYIAHTEGIKFGVAWAGLASWMAGEGLFKLKVSSNGKGIVFFGAYGGITKKKITGDFVVDTGHLVAYEPGVKMSVGMAGGLFGSMTSGEGLVNKLSGNGNIYLQSRSIDGLVKFLSSK